MNKRAHDREKRRAWARFEENYALPLFFFVFIVPVLFAALYLIGFNSI